MGEVGPGCLFLTVGFMSARAMNGRFQLLRHPGVEAFAGEGGSEVDLTMKLGGDASDELAREGLVRFFAPFLTENEVVIDGLTERPG